MRHVAMAAVAMLTAAQVAPSQGERLDLLEDARVRAALEQVRRAEPRTIDDQVRLCEVAAPPFGEGPRAALFERMLRAAGIGNVRRDPEGNVVGERAGRSSRPIVVLAAHLDTVFPEKTPVTVRRDGALLRGPGIGDNCRGLAVLLAVARAFGAAGVETDGSVAFAATVGEEGLGDLRGAKALFASTLKGRIDRFVAIDGSGFEITNIGVGSRRYRVRFRGAGGHSYMNFGRANPAHALGRAVGLISELQVPASPKTTFSVGRIGGGTSINAIPEESWMEIDLRSSDPAALDALDRRVREIVERAAALENARWNQSGRITVRSERVGDRPAGRTDERSPIVQTALSISKAMGIAAPLVEGSTEANVAMQWAIPGIAIGAGGRGSGVHSLEESFDTTGSSAGTERALLLTIALSRR